MSKTYIYQTPKETYLNDRRTRYEERYVKRVWQTEFETTNYTEMLDYINGKTPIRYDEEGNVLEYNTPDSVYRVLEQAQILQEGELVSPWDDWQSELEDKFIQTHKEKELA